MASQAKTGDKWYVVSYYDSRNSHTYKQPVKAPTKAHAKSRVVEGDRYLKKVSVRLMKK